jgi:acetyltransferase-like isoleucine patch superfamily enzyme
MLIGSNDWLAGGSVLLPVSMEGDGAVVAESAPSGAIFGGVPVRQLGIRQ